MSYGAYGGRSGVGSQLNGRFLLGYSKGYARILGYSLLFIPSGRGLALLASFGVLEFDIRGCIRAIRDLGRSDLCPVLGSGLACKLCHQNIG